MSVGIALGKQFATEFASCGHGQADEYTRVLDAIGSGDELKVRGGLHQAAGHATGRSIIGNVDDHYRVVTEVASGIARGDFSLDGVGLLTAGTQFRVAELAKREGCAVSPDKILGLFDAAVANPRGEEFERWMRVTTLAGLRESSDAKEATSFIRRLLAFSEVTEDIARCTPSKMREGLMLAAPFALHPLLLECYDRSVRYGAPLERSLALLSIEQVPAKLSQTADSRIISVLKEWARRYSGAIDALLDNPAVTVVAKPPPQEGLWNRSDLNSISKRLSECVR